MHSTPYEPVNVLWTSGWDSTYRVVDLVLVQKQYVRPWYVVDPDRRSAWREVKNMETMFDALKDKDPEAAGRLFPPKVLLKQDIPDDAEITAAYQELARKYQLGVQYDWLARLAKWKDIQLELSVHADDKFREVLGDLTVEDEDGSHRLKPGVEDPVFERFAFPLLAMSKLDMQEASTKHGFVDIQEMTWFCFNPLLGGKPCGVCNPCKYTREEGLGRRVPDATWGRKLQARALNKGHRVLNRLVKVY